MNEVEHQLAKQQLVNRYYELMEDIAVSYGLDDAPAKALVAEIAALRGELTIRLMDMDAARNGE